MLFFVLRTYLSCADHHTGQASRNDRIHAMINRINPIEVIGITTVLMIYPTPKKQTMDCIVDPKSDNKKNNIFDDLFIIYQ